MRAVAFALVISLISMGIAALGLLWLLRAYFTESLAGGYAYLYFFILFYGGWIYLLAYPVHQGIAEKQKQTAARSLLIGAGIGMVGSLLVLGSNVGCWGKGLQPIWFVAAFGMSGAVYGLLCFFLPRQKRAKNN